MDKGSNFSLVITQLDINKYMATFRNMDRHIPDLIADELNNNFSDCILFAATRSPDREKQLVEMEIHLSKVCDVADLIQISAMNQQEKLLNLAGKIIKAGI